jgi:hypothetical protein
MRRISRRTPPSAFDRGFDAVIPPAFALARAHAGASLRFCFVDEGFRLRAILATPHARYRQRPAFTTF